MTKDALELQAEYAAAVEADLWAEQYGSSHRQLDEIRADYAAVKG